MQEQSELQGKGFSEEDKWVVFYAMYIIIWLTLKLLVPSDPADG